MITCFFDPLPLIAKQVSDLLSRLCPDLANTIMETLASVGWNQRTRVGRVTAKTAQGRGEKREEADGREANSQSVTVTLCDR